MKDQNVNEKKQYETPKMELLVITGREVMESEHDNSYIDWGDFWNDLFGGYTSQQGYYDE